MAKHDHVYCWTRSHKPRQNTHLRCTTCGGRAPKVVFRHACRSCGATGVHLCGPSPSLYPTPKPKPERSPWLRFRRVRTLADLETLARIAGYRPHVKPSVYRAARRLLADLGISLAYCLRKRLYADTGRVDWEGPGPLTGNRTVRLLCIGRKRWSVEEDEFSCFGEREVLVDEKDARALGHQPEPFRRRSLLKAQRAETLRLRRERAAEEGGVEFILPRAPIVRPELPERLPGGYTVEGWAYGRNIWVRDAGGKLQMLSGSGQVQKGVH